MEIPNGVYKAQTKDRQLTQTSKGLPQAAIEFELLEPGWPGKRMTYFGSFSEAAFPHTAKALRASGWKGSDLSDMSGDMLEVSLVIENEEYEGKTRAKVKWVNAPGGINAKPLPPAEAKQFAQQMKARFLAFDQTKGGPQPQTGSGINDTDIPF